MESPAPPSSWATFPALSALPQFRNAFTLRHPEIEVTVDREEALRRLTSWHHEVVAELGFPVAKFATANQVHGNQVAVVSAASPEAVPNTDGLVCNTPGIILGIYVADCGAVYFADPVSGAFGLVHSGRKGTELNITGEAIATMQREFGTRPEDVIVQLSPCIRPPVYEVDFAADIRQQAIAAGVRPENVHDDGVCTSSDPALYYSYRVEKGKTGRMLALLGRTA
ncbi:polyphenol oxidase family protein [Verrucomicrobium sp. BvORR034]|uniref:polyphenol oxidase family protein n=1 Tax=Verrucomicrobium sp. BvORR034 TaxID=1396418 RepID=UPI000679D479|nr:polyphenol oxidase family protein [Verrucomicrobium sp. BvORR034]